jgi:hypothetical protein
VFAKISGKLYPPKKKIGVIVLKSTIEEYSLKKKKTKIIEECSTKKPATNSDSKIFLNYNLHIPHAGTLLRSR